MISRLILLLLLFSCAVSKGLGLLNRVEEELNKMIAFHRSGDTSHAFSIALKVHYAIKALHQDLEIVHDSPPRHSGLSCQQLLGEIVKTAESVSWQHHFETMMQMVEQMQQQCTNSDFASTDLESGFQNECALCVVILRVIENYVNYHRVDAAHFVNQQLCTLFDSNIKPTCQAFVHFAGPIIIQTLYSREPSDKVCLALGLCRDKNCRIVKDKAKQYGIVLEEVPKATIPSPWKWLVHLFVDHFGNSHLPAFDLDNDTYSDVSTFRGYHWRGSDCNQIQGNIYPGRKKGSKWLDYDCNGIFGIDNLGRHYEDKFCAPYKRLGIAVIGDSAGAHFEIPAKYFNVSMINKDTYFDLLPRLADELDLPQDSAYTGHRNTSYASRSVYKYLRGWNLCNHNDFQNIGVNGGSSGNTRSNINALTRNQQEDYPLLMFLELIGNDVCKKSFNSMTTVQNFERDVNYLLDFMDKKVPEGSHLVILGLGDGNILYENLHDTMHPLNVTYATVYDFLNCLQISPCWGWLNSNQTVRQFATQRAQNLSKVYQKIVSERTFKHFDIAYYDFPSMEILERKIEEGGDPKSMIEPCDGFHPNGEFNSYLADWLWYRIRMDHPDWIGQKNPHNQEIKNIFGLNDLL